jgi:competence protein ComFC
MLPTIRTIYLNTMDFILPMRCTFCNYKDLLSSKISICKRCFLKMEKEKNHNRCQVCKSILDENFCEYCTSRNIFFERMEYLYFKGEIQSELMNKMKFYEEPFLGNYFRIGLKKKWNRFQFPKFSILTTIPSNGDTVRKRPIHPVSSIHPVLKMLTGCENKNILIKVSNLKQGDQTYRQRFIHARYSMEIAKNHKNSLSGNILLIDDLFTTGATMNEASRILLENGAEKVFLLSLLRGD